MKKYLIIGLAILLGTNFLVLAGVAYNRMGDASAQLTLTERELALPYDSSFQKENSGISLSINWRTPTKPDQTYYAYNSRDLTISEDELLALGFEQSAVENDAWFESRELYWALEFDGALHKAEIEKAAMKYQNVIAAYAEQSNDKNTNNKEEHRENLERERISNSRLFFVEAAADYKSLVTKFSGQRNMLYVKGLARPYYNPDEETFSLMLGQLSISNIMLPLEHTKVFSGLHSLQSQDIKPPRYAVEIKWGTRLEPWVVDVKKLTN